MHDTHTSGCSTHATLQHYIALTSRYTILMLTIMLTLINANNNVISNVIYRSCSSVHSTHHSHTPVVGS